MVLVKKGVNTEMMENEMFGRRNGYPKGTSTRAKFAGADNNSRLEHKNSHSIQYTTNSFAGHRLSQKHIHLVFFAESSVSRSYISKSVFAQ